MKRVIVVVNFYCAFMVLMGCFLKQPTATMTKDYLEVVRPGQSFAIVELKDVKLDSVFEYPIEEIPVRSFTLVNRNSHSKIGENASFKVRFSKKYKKYCWKVSPDPFYLIKPYYADTINIKSNVWYRLTTSSFHFNVYFYFDSIKQTEITKIKPFAGAW